MSAIRSWFVTSTLEQAETDDIDRVTDLEGLFMLFHTNLNNMSHY